MLHAIPIAFGMINIIYYTIKELLTYGRGLSMYWKPGKIVYGIHSRQ
jgi:hypothetical protein